MRAAAVCHTAFRAAAIPRPACAESAPMQPEPCRRSARQVHDRPRVRSTERFRQDLAPPAALASRASTRASQRSLFQLSGDFSSDQAPPARREPLFDQFTQLLLGLILLVLANQLPKVFARVPICARAHPLINVAAQGLREREAHSVSAHGVNLGTTINSCQYHRPRGHRPDKRSCGLTRLSDSANVIQVAPQQTWQLYSDVHERKARPLVQARVAPRMAYWIAYSAKDALDAMQARLDARVSQLAQEKRGRTARS